MLVAVPDLAPHDAWVQVLGRVAIHRNENDSHRLTGSGQRLLSVLVAAGRDGTTSERIAEEIWADDQPNPWRPALRMAVARLRKQLPDDWDIVSAGGTYRITTGDGWIDAWRLAEIASTQAAIDEPDLLWMLAGQPFGDLDMLEMVGDTTQHLRMLQITVAERFCSRPQSSITTSTCAVLTALVREHPYNDRLAVGVGRTLAAAGRRTEAVSALSAFAEIYTSEFGAVPVELADFLASGGDDTGQAGAANFEAKPTELAKELRHLVDIPLLGREAELAALREARGALVLGAIGSGKSRLLAELIVGDDGTDSTYVVGDDRLDLALGPFAVAMPELRDELLASATDEAVDVRADSSIDKAAATRAWRIVLAHLEARSETRPQRLVVDDAHLLDAASLGLLRLLIRSNTASDVTIVVCGRNDFEDADWIDFARDAERAGLDQLILEGLGIEELRQLVYVHFPEATRQSRQGLANDVLEASAGLPAVAGPLIASADPMSLTLPEQLSGATALARVTGALPERDAEIVAAASVLGHTFSIGALMALTEADETVIFEVLDELWSTGLIVETDDPDQVRFRHALIQQAFLDRIPMFRRSHLNRRAAELTNDVHQRADHQANAGGLIPAHVAAASLQASARLYANSRQWRKVSRQLLRAHELSGRTLDAAALTLWATALDLSGADGSDQRRMAYQAATEAKDWTAALDAALAGLPEAERADGDRERVEMLEQIAERELSADKRFDRVFYLSRQHALLGDHDRAVEYADQALDLAVDADEIGLSHVCRWTATRHIDPEPHVFPSDVMLQGSIRVRARLAQMNAISEAERGDFEAARREAARFDALAAELADPVRIWQSLGLKAMFALNDGHIDNSSALARQALEFADLHALQLGTSAYIGQFVHSYDVQDRLAELSTTLEPFRANLASSMLGRAGLAVCDAASGVEDLEAEVNELVGRAVARPSSSTLMVLAYVARLVPRFAPELIEPTRAFVEPFGDRPILVGFGATNLGPAVCYTAQLASSRGEQVALVQRSVRAADRHGSLLWRVRTRLDLANLGSGESLAEAADLAAGTGLAQVVERRRRILEAGD